MTSDQPSLRQLTALGELDPQLAALLWLLAEHGLPLTVASVDRPAAERTRAAIVAAAGTGRAARLAPAGGVMLADSLEGVLRVLGGEAALNDATMIIVQIESAGALACADEIVAVDGVDMVLVGLNDLLADWGIPGEYDHPRVREAYAATIATCRKRRKHCGVGGLATRPDLVAEFVRMGARYVSTGTDLGFLMGALTARAKAVREIEL